MIYFTPLGYLVDLLVGDSTWIMHPVICQGHLISLLERVLNHSEYSPVRQRINGLFTVLVTVATATLCTWLIVLLGNRVHPILGFVIAVWLISTTIAQKGLKQAAKSVAESLEAGELSLARLKTAEIVGRDTTQLSDHELIRATVETVAENTVDGITAPLFYAFIGAAPLAMAYRTANTLDSMLGYKNKRYIHFGWAAARFDDLVNFVPARLTALIIPLAAALLGLNAKGCLKIIKRDAFKHSSPNSGYLEAGFAGALDITLGGVNVYGNRVSTGAYLGEVKRNLVSADILAAIRLMEMVSLLVLVFLFFIFCITRWFR